VLRPRGWETPGACSVPGCRVGCDMPIQLPTADDPVTLIQGDCLDVLRSLPDGCVDAVVTDPPYGIGEARGRNKTRSCLAQSRDYGTANWDDDPCTPGMLAEIRRVSRWQVIFGGNYFDLPPSSCWLVWDKLNGENDFADCELAWTNLPKAVRRIQHRWHGMIRQDNEERFHPTQKPLKVMRWCLRQLPPECQTILDPFAGSGTTGVAALQAGLRCLLVEREPAYCDIIRRRLAHASGTAPGSLFAGANLWSD
jgi:DNA modification methylase